MTKKIRDCLVIAVGCFLLAVGIHMFYEPNQMVTGGVSGLAIVIKHYTGIPLWVTNLALNAPLFLIGMRIKGKAFLARTLYATVFLSVALFIAGYLPPVETDYFLASIFGGVFSGIGLGLVFGKYSTTGGTDLAASLVHSFVKHVSVSKILFILDTLIIVIGWFAFGSTRAMYAIIAVFIATKVIDTILEGLSFAKVAFIISDHSEEISRLLMQELDRGVTTLSGKGMYTGSQKNIIFSVVSKKEIVVVKELIKTVDAKAFVIVSDAREVMGEGFSLDV